MTEQIDLDWLERLAQTRSITASEIIALVAIARAAQAAGPWPLLRKETFIQGDWYLECFHCGADNAVNNELHIIHALDCRGVALRDALAAIKEATRDR